MVEFLKFISTRKLGFLVVVTVSILISYTVNSYKKVDYYYDIGIYVDPIVVFNDVGTAKEIVFSYDTIFASKAFYIEHNRTRIQGSYPRLIKKDNDTMRVIISNYDDSYTFGKDLLKKIYNESLVRIQYYQDAGIIFKTQVEKDRFSKIKSSGYDNSEIFIYHFSPVQTLSVKDNILYVFMTLLGLGIYISFLLIEFSLSKTK